jgi:hypothetical protein
VNAAGGGRENALMLHVCRTMMPTTVTLWHSHSWKKRAGGFIDDELMDIGRRRRLCLWNVGSQISTPNE